MVGKDVCAEWWVGFGSHKPYSLLLSLYAKRQEFSSQVAIHHWKLLGILSLLSLTTWQKKKKKERNKSKMAFSAYLCDRPPWLRPGAELIYFYKVSHSRLSDVEAFGFGWAFLNYCFWLRQTSHHQLAVFLFFSCAMAKCTNSPME